MKKLFTLILAIAAFAMGTEKAYASLLQDWEVTLESGMCFSENENTKAQYVVWLLDECNQIVYSYDDATQTTTYSSPANKILFTISKTDGIVTIADGVTSADDISYTLTYEDRARIGNNDIELYNYLAGIRTLILHFGSSGDIDSETLYVTLKSGMNLDAEENIAANNAFLALYMAQQIYGFYNDPAKIFEFYLSATDKLLFTQTEDGVVTVSSKVTDDDDIIYTLTDADRELIKEEGVEIYEYLRKYRTIHMHFVPGNGGGDIDPINPNAFVGTVKTGTELSDDTGTVLLLLREYFNQLKMEAELDEDGEFTGNVLYLSMADKLLFIQDYDTNILTIADGVTSADNIIYTITDEDRERLLTTAPDAYQFISPYTTIELHFDTSSGGGGDFPELPEIHGELGNQGIWYFEDGVLTVDYIGQMPQNCTKDTTDPEVAYRLKWLDLLPQIKEIVITGKDVEIQPYFLYYEGDGPSGSHPDDHVKKLTLGSGVKKVGKQALTLYDLKDVYCYGIEPPELSSDTGGSNCFWKSRIQANVAFLHVVPNASTNYFRTDREWINFNLWSSFLDPKDDPVGVNEVHSSESIVHSSSAIYDLSGRKVSKPQKGFNIIRYSDGTTKKVMVK